MQKISPKNIAEAVYEATKEKAEEDLTAVLKRSARMLKGKRMLGQSSKVLNALQDIFDKKTNTVRMKVTTAKSMEHERRNKLENEIKEKYSARSIASEFFVQEELLGGAKIEIGEEVLDTTYKNKIYKLEKFLTK